MERQKFEDSLKDAFANAEVSPDPTVWTNIELDLERKRGVVLQKRIVFYQTLAAASVILALAVGISVYMISPEPQMISSVEKKGMQSESKGSPLVNASPESSERDNDSGNKSSGNKATDVSMGSGNSSRKFSNGAQHTNPVAYSVADITAGETSQAREDEFQSVVVTTSMLPSLVKLPPLALKIPSAPKEEIDPVAAMLAKLQARELELRQEKKKSKKEGNEQVWTSLGVSAGTFRTTNATVNSGARSTGFTSANDPAAKEAKASGNTYTLGMNVGTKISSRWIVQGGINYQSQSSNYTANSVVGNADFSNFKPATINELENLEKDKDNTGASGARLLTTAPFNVTNNLRYLSVPLQAGYLVLNRDFGVQLNAGISTDLFLQSSVKAEGDVLSDSKQSLGEDTPYRTVNFSGLMGTELSYRFNDHYRLALNPGLRYSLSNIYHSDVNVKASPFTFDVGVRFRYIFH